MTSINATLKRGAAEMAVLFSESAVDVCTKNTGGNTSEDQIRQAIARTLARTENAILGCSEIIASRRVIEGGAH